MRLDIFKLYFTGPVHLSKGKLNTYESSDQVLHSDTIKSALFVNALQLFDDIDDKEAFFDSFQVSSAFPFTPDGYFFPKPLHFAPTVKAEERKEFKTASIFTNRRSNASLQVKIGWAIQDC